jgi:prolyl oligopeptidase
MLTRHPSLFGAVVAHVPVLDMWRYHRLLAGASWMAEYGDPDVAADWEFLRRYSPYHNIDGDRSYPPVLLVTSTRDDRVHPGHARKMAARLREHGHEVSYYENVEGGHGAAANNEQRAFVWALTLEFLWRKLAGRPHQPLPRQLVPDDVEVPARRPEPAVLDGVQLPLTSPAQPVPLARQQVDRGNESGR